MKAKIKYYVKFAKRNLNDSRYYLKAFCNLYPDFCLTDDYNDNNIFITEPQIDRYKTRNNMPDLELRNQDYYCISGIFVEKHKHFFCGSGDNQITKDLFLLIFYNNFSSVEIFIIENAKKYSHSYFEYFQQGLFNKQLKELRKNAFIVNSPKKRLWYIKRRTDLDSKITKRKKQW
jgi:hypothetical protein